MEETKDVSLEEVDPGSILAEADDVTEVSSRRMALHYKGKVTRGTLLRVLLAALTLLIERTSFVSLMYNKDVNLMLVLLLVLAFNTAYYYVYTLSSKKKHKIALYSAFKLSRTPPISVFLVAFLGFIDMLGTLTYWKGFCTTPMVNAISLLQMTIVINFSINFVSAGFNAYKLHIFSAVVITIGSVLSYVGLAEDYSPAALILIGLGVNGISHGVRLWLIQKQPVNIIRLSFKTSLAEFLFVLLLSPAIFTVLSSPNCLDQPIDCVNAIGKAFEILVTTLLLVAFVGYVVGTIVIDYVIGKFVAERYTISTRLAYMASVPITLAGGLIAVELYGYKNILAWNALGVTGILVTFAGTCAFNSSEEKPFDMSTEAVSY